MSIPLALGFHMGSALPLDDRDVVADMTARDAIASGIRFEGMRVYVIDADGSGNPSFFYLKNGITNGDWAQESSTPPGGDQYDILTKNSSTDFDASWTALNLSGFRPGGVPWSSTGIIDAVTQLVGLVHVPPTISLSMSPSQAIREIGDTISSVDFSALTTKFSSPIVSVEYKTGASYGSSTSIFTDSGVNPNGATETYTDATSFDGQKSFFAVVSDSLGYYINSNIVTFSAVYPWYYGVGAPGLGAAVSGLTKDISGYSNPKYVTLSPSGEKMYFAIWAGWGHLITSILDPSGFETRPDWTYTTEVIVGLDGTNQVYYVYESTNVVTLTSFTQRFI